MPSREERCRQYILKHHSWFKTPCYFQSIVPIDENDPNLVFWFYSADSRILRVLYDRNTESISAVSLEDEFRSD